MSQGLLWVLLRRMRRRRLAEGKSARRRAAGAEARMGFLLKEDGANGLYVGARAMIYPVGICLAVSFYSDLESELL